MSEVSTLPQAANDAFIAVQAAMLAIVRGDREAASRCLEIALKALQRR
jgi:hypothetical protein